MTQWAKLSSITSNLVTNAVVNRVGSTAPWVNYSTLLLSTRLWWKRSSQWLMLHVCWCQWSRAATTQSVIHQWTLATTCRTFSNDFLNHLQTMNERWKYIWNESDHFPSAEFVSTPIVSWKKFHIQGLLAFYEVLLGPGAQKRFQWRTKHEQKLRKTATISSHSFNLEFWIPQGDSIFPTKLKSPVEFAMKMLLVPFLPQNESFQDPTLGCLIGHGQGP